MPPLLLTIALAAAADPACEPAALGEPLRVYLVSTAPGDHLFDRFGHSALWVSGARWREDVVFNWGSYNRNTPNPAGRFLQGRMDYWLALDTWDYVANKAQRHDRSLVLQALALPPIAAERMDILLNQANRPENRVYRYHWRDTNCATRIRDIVDQALEGDLRTSTAGLDPTRSARSEVLRHLAPEPAAWFGWNFMANNVADVPMTPWDGMFLPDRLMQAFDATQVEWPDGSRRPLVSRTCTIRVGANDWLPDQAPDRRWLMGLLGLLWGGLALLLGHSHRPRALGLSAMTLGLFGGALGTASLTVWRWSVIAGLGPNANWFQANPLTFALAICGLLLGLRGRPGPLATPIATLLAGVSAIGLVFSLSPLTAQHSGAIIALFLPALLGTAGGLWRLRPR